MGKIGKNHFLCARISLNKVIESCFQKAIQLHVDCEVCSRYITSKYQELALFYEIYYNILGKCKETLSNQTVSSKRNNEDKMKKIVHSYGGEIYFFKNKAIAR